MKKGLFFLQPSLRKLKYICANFYFALFQTWVITTFIAMQLARAIKRPLVPFCFAIGAIGAIGGLPLLPLQSKLISRRAFGLFHSRLQTNCERAIALWLLVTNVSLRPVFQLKLFTGLQNLNFWLVSVQLISNRILQRVLAKMVVFEFATVGGWHAHR